MDYSKNGKNILEAAFYVDIRDFCSELIKKVWIIVLSMIIFAIIFGGYSYVKSANNIESETNPVLEKEELMADMTEEELAKVNDYLLVMEELSSMQQYMKDSVVMNIPTNEVYKNDIQYYIYTEDDTELTNIIIAYNNYITKGGLVADIYTENKEIEQKYLQELIYCESTEYDSYLSSNILSISIYGQSEEQCNVLTQQVDKVLKNFGDVVSTTVCEHELNTLSRTLTNDVEQKILEYKTRKIATLADLQTKVNSYKSLLNENQLLLVTDGETHTEEQVVSAAEPKLSIKYILVGAFVGMILAIGIICVIYVINNTLKTNEFIRNHYGLSFFGDVYDSEKKQWDIFAEKLLFRNIEENKEKGYELICKKIIMACKNSGVDKLAIVGHFDEEMSKEIERGLKQVKESGIKLQLCGDVVNNALGIDKIAGTSHAVLVEFLHKSKLTDIDQLVMFCTEQSIQVLGYAIYR